MSRFAPIGRILRGTAAAALTALGAGPAAAQQPVPQPLPQPLPDLSGYLMPDTVAPAAGFGRAGHGPGCPTPCPPAYNPCYPGYPGYPVTPSPVPGMPDPGTGMPPVPGVPDAGAAAPPPGFDQAEFAGRGRGAGAGPVAGQGGYIENAAPVTMFRLRGDFAYRSNRPDRAEYFYTNIPGLPQESVDYQELTPRAEFAVSRRFSAFVDIPTRYLNPDVSPNTAGIGDINFGIKYAFLYTERRILTFQLLTVAPTGNTFKGLGTAHWWVEPGILWLEQLSARWQVFGEVRDRIPISPQSDFTGNVLRYGLGTSYVVCDGRWGYVAPVVESVGWTALSGRELVQGFTSKDASGDTIVNLKLGVRIGIGAPALGQAYPTKSDVYIGYGRALTGAVWYKDMFRVEFRRFF